MSVYKLASANMSSFLQDLADGEDFTYEVTFKKDKLVNTIRTKDPFVVCRKIEQFNTYRDVFISPFNTQYPERSSDFVHGRRMISSNSIAIDIDSKTDSIVDYKIVLKKLKQAKIAKPTYLVSTGSGCHLWYMLTQHVGRSKIIDIHEKIKKKVSSIDWPEGWVVDNLSAKQQIRVPLTVNHKYDKIAVIVSKGKKLHIKSHEFTRPEQFTKKELKLHRKLKKLSAPAKPTISKQIKDKTSKPNNFKNDTKKKFLEGAKNTLKVTIKEKIHVCREKLSKIIKLLKYGKSFLSCRIAGEALGISYKAAATFLRRCVALGYLEKYTDHNTAYCYNVKVNCEIEMENKKSKRSRCAISGPGESNKAICKLAFQTYVNKLNPEKTINKWLNDYYCMTSKEHSPEELMATFDKVFDNFRNKLYEPYKTSPT